MVAFIRYTGGNLAIEPKIGQLGISMAFLLYENVDKVVMNDKLLQLLFLYCHSVVLILYMTLINKCQSSANIGHIK